MRGVHRCIPLCHLWLRQHCTRLICLLSGQGSSSCPAFKQLYCAYNHSPNIVRHNAICARFMSTTLTRRLTYDDCEKVIDDLVDQNKPQFCELLEIFDCSEDEVKEIIKRDNRILTSRNLELTRQKVQVLYDHGFKNDDLLYNAIWLYFSVKKISKRLEILKPFAKYKLYTSYVLVLNEQSFQNLVETLNKDLEVLQDFPDRDSCVASLLECDVKTVKEMASQGHKYLLTRHVSELNALIQLFHKGGIISQYIRDKPQLLKLPVYLVQERMDLAEKLSIRDPENVITLVQSVTRDVERRAAKYSTKEQIGKSKEEYLKERLHLETDLDVEHLLCRSPVLRNIHIHRLKHMLDFLLDECQFHPKYIVYSLNVFTHKQEKLRKRFMELKNSNIHCESHDSTILRLMCLSNNKYEKLFL